MYANRQETNTSYTQFTHSHERTHVHSFRKEEKNNNIMNTNCDRDLEFLLLLIIINSRIRTQCTMHDSNKRSDMSDFFSLSSKRWNCVGMSGSASILILCIFKCAIEGNWTGNFILYFCCVLLLRKCQSKLHFCNSYKNYFFFAQRISNSIWFQRQSTFYFNAVSYSRFYVNFISNVLLIERERGR